MIKRLIAAKDITDHAVNMVHIVTIPSHSTSHVMNK